MKIKYSVNVELEIEISDEALYQPYTYLNQSISDGSAVLTVTTQNCITGELVKKPVVNLQCKDYKRVLEENEVCTENK